MKRLLIILLLCCAVFGDEITTHQVPTTDSLLNLGANTFRWLNIYGDDFYFDGTQYSLIKIGANGIMESLGIATNGQIPIGSTGADPVVNEIDGTASEIAVTNGAGTITLSMLSPYTTLVDDTMADTLHRHSELSASDGTPDKVLSIQADGEVYIEQSADSQDTRLFSYSTNPGHRARIYGSKSASNTIGVAAETADGEKLLSIIGRGVDSSGGFAANGVEIVFEQDGAAGVNVIPGRIIFKTGTATAGTATAMTIDSDKQILIENNISVGTASPAAGFSGTGDIYATSGIKAMEGLYSEAVAYGAGLEVSDNALAVTYTNAANGDATLTAATRLITDSHASFTSAYIGQFLKVASSTPSFTGATGEIVGVPSGTTLIVSFATSGSDVIVDATAMTFVVYPQPIAFIGDNGDIHFSVGINEEASFKIISPYGKNDHSAHAVVTAGVDGHTGIDLEIDAGTYGGVSGYGLTYDATDFVDGISGTGINVTMENTGATGGDIHVMDVAVTDPSNTDMDTIALGTNEGVEVIHQHLGDAAVVAAGFTYDLSTTTYTDTTVAFGATGTNVQMFVEDNDKIYVASATMFDQINVLLAIAASSTIRPTFTYSVDDGTWVTFIPSDDTSGFQNSGTIRFDSDALTTWGPRTVNEVTGAAGAVDYYWIRIKRKRNIVATLPTESTIQVTATGTFHSWDSEGRLGIKTFNQAAEPTTTDLPAGKFCFWTDTDDSKLYICYNHGGTVKTTEMN